MNTLNKSRCYLSGPMEDADDGGAGWRIELIQKSKDVGLGIRYIDPCNKPSSCTKEIINEKHIGDVYREEKNWPAMQKFVKSFRREDLRFTDIADFLILRVDPDCHMCGSYDELFLAERQRKPIFCIIEAGIERLPSWLFGVFDMDNIFTSVDECIERLVELDNTPLEELENDWVLIGQQLDDDDCVDDPTDVDKDIQTQNIETWVQMGIQPKKEIMASSGFMYEYWVITRVNGSVDYMWMVGEQPDQKIVTRLSPFIIGENFLIHAPGSNYTSEHFDTTIVLVEATQRGENWGWTIISERTGDE